MTVVPPTEWRCDRLADALPDLLEGELSAAERADAERHLDGCADCRALVADLRAIAGDAAALPALRPERDLWAGIEARIAAPVVSLDARRPAAPPSRAAAGPARLALSPRRLAAAAVLLVALSSGTTWWAMRDPGAPVVAARPVASGVDGAASRTVAVAPEAPASGAASPEGDAAPNAAAVGDGAVGDGAVGERATSEAAARRALRADRAARSAGGASSSALVVDRGARGDVAAARSAGYDREIATLRALVAARRRELDPATVAEVERNLRIVDEAIARSRAALARDPRSSLVGDQLTRALGSKVELLRTLATLPRA